MLARISHEQIDQLFRGYGYEPFFVEGSERESMHQAIAATLEHYVEKIRAIQADALRQCVFTTPLADDYSPHAERLDCAGRN